MSKVLIVLLALLSIIALLTGCAPAAATPVALAPASATSSGYPPPAVSSPTVKPGYPPPSTPETTTGSTAYPAQGGSGNGLQVVTADGTAKQVTLADLNDLPKATVGSDSGPRLIDVLQFANIFDFSTVTITGSNGSKDLTKDQVTDQVILTLSNNSVSLVIGSSNNQAIKDVTSINAK